MVTTPLLYIISSEEIVEELAIEKVKAYVRTRQQSDEVLDGKHAHTNVDYEVCDEMHTGLADIAVNHLLGAPRFRLKSPHAASDVRKRCNEDAENDKGRYQFRRSGRVLREVERKIDALAEVEVDDKFVEKQNILPRNQRIPL